jgi:uncharacterized membrane protein
MASAIDELTEGLTPQELLLLKDQNHDTLLYTCAIVFTIVTVAAVFVRATSRHMKKVAFGIDDALIVIALVSNPLSTAMRRKRGSMLRTIW